MKKRFSIIAIVISSVAVPALAQVNLTPAQLQPPGNTAWTLNTLDINGTVAFKLLVEHTGSASANSFYFDTQKNGFPGSVGTTTDDAVLFTAADGPGKIATVSVPPNANLSLFHDITNISGVFLSGPDGVLNTEDAYLNSNPVYNFTRQGPVQLIKYYGADPFTSYTFTAWGQTVHLGSGFIAFIFVEEDHTPNYDYNDMIIGILPPCDKDADCNDGLFCNGVEHCAFQTTATGGVCMGGTPPVCDDGVGCTANECKEQPGGYTCLYKPHDQDCDDGDQCNGKEVCDPVRGCLPGKKLNCDDGIACTSDTCVKGMCVNKPVDSLCSDGNVCNGAEICNRNKGCTPGTPLVCGDNLFCNGVELCDPVAGCLPGTPVNCSHLSGVCVTGICDEQIDACVAQPAGDNTPCSDGLYCNGAEVCLGGQCVGGNPVDCNDHVNCTVDSCDEATDSCVHTPDHELCDDDLYCNGVETCDPVLGCKPGTPPLCDDQLACTVDSCDEQSDSCVHAPNDALCDDGLYCNGVETCDPLAGCIPGIPPVCDDGIDCTTSRCDEATDACVHQPNDNLCLDQNVCNGVETCDPQLGCQPGTPLICDDGLYCNGVEICDPAAGCLPGLPPVCDDQISCTINACDEATDSCVYTPDDTLCDNGQFCDGLKVCNPVSGCQDGPHPVCDDGVDCTTNRCNTTLGACEFIPDDSFCQNGLFCDGEEVCDPVLGCVDRPDIICNDEVDCTIDECDEEIDLCVYTPDDSLCDDGLFCNGSETCGPNGCEPGGPPCAKECNEVDDNCEPICDCNETFCTPYECIEDVCVPEDPPDCDDELPCTIDRCDAVLNACVHEPDHTLCSDGEYCNGAEICDPLLGCIPGAIVNCDDQIPCTFDACNEEKDVCTHTPDDSICNDSQYCNGIEICHPIEGCLPGTPPNCGDNIPCTVDTCDEATDTCVNTPNGAACQDERYCNGVEICHPTQGCIPGTPVICNDGVDCTTDECVEATDSCASTPNNAFCQNGLFCDGTEVCHPTQGCQPGSAPPCDDGLACTSDSCDEPTDQCVNTCIPPQITCTDQVFECDDVGPFDPPDVVDPCNPNAVANCTDVTTPGKLPQEYTVTRTCSYTNKCGASNSCPQVIRVEDTTPPEIECPPDERVECDAVIVPGQPIVSDNCATEIKVNVTVEEIIGDCTPNTAGISPPPKLIRLNTFTASDGSGATFAEGTTADGDTSGNSASCTQRVEIIDTKPPVFIACPGEVAGCVGLPLSFTPPTCSDTCGPCSVVCTRSDGLPMNAPVPDDPLTVRCVATDECANASAPCDVEVSTVLCDDIPTISQWGLVVLTLLLLIGAKLRFARPQYVTC